MSQKKEKAYVISIITLDGYLAVKFGQFLLMGLLLESGVVLFRIDSWRYVLGELSGHPIQAIDNALPAFNTRG